MLEERTRGFRQHAGDMQPTLGQGVGESHATLLHATTSGGEKQRDAATKGFFIYLRNVGNCLPMLLSTSLFHCTDPRLAV